MTIPELSRSRFHRAMANKKPTIPPSLLLRADQVIN